MRPNRKHRRRMARLARMRAIQEQMSAASLEDLVTACRHAYRRHDPRIVALTFAVLCAKVGKLIIWHVRRCRPNASDAELLDYAQELHAKLLTDIRTGQSETYAERNFRAYMHRRLLDILDKESTRFEARSKCVEPTETRDPIGVIPSNDNLLEQTATLQAWMQRLSAEDQKLATLRLHGFTEIEIALRLGISERTVRERLKCLLPALGIARSSP